MNRGERNCCEGKEWDDVDHDEAFALARQANGKISRKNERTYLKQIQTRARDDKKDTCQRKTEVPMSLGSIMCTGIKMRKRPSPGYEAQAQHFKVRRRTLLY
jgi:hypothetical protein